MDADKTIYPTACDYLAIKRRIDDLICERAEIDAAIQDESHAAAQLAAVLIRSMRAADVVLADAGRVDEIIVLLGDRLEIRPLTSSDAVPLVAEDVFDKIPPIDPEPSLEEAIAEAQTHRTVWGEMMISPVTEINAGDFLDAWKVNLFNNWTPPTDAEIDAAEKVKKSFAANLPSWTPPTDAELDAAAAGGAIDDVFHADEEVE
jgi:hypothetical protein